MKIKMNNHLEIALRNLQTLEKNCVASTSGFEPSTTVCMYLIECILPVIDQFPVKALRHITVKTTFTNSSELLEFLDTTVGRMKRTEFYALSKEEIEKLNVKVALSTYDFIVQPNLSPLGQLEKFLRDLLNRLSIIHEIEKDPRRNQAKLSYLSRMSSVPMNDIASILEALSAGIATNVQT